MGAPTNITFRSMDKAHAFRTMFHPEVVGQWRAINQELRKILMGFSNKAGWERDHYGTIIFYHVDDVRAAKWAYRLWLNDKLTRNNFRGYFK